MEKTKSSKSSTTKKQKKSSSTSKRKSLKSNLPRVTIDFDGVIHSYLSGWKGADVIPDKPVMVYGRRAGVSKTSIDWLRELVSMKQVSVAIFSTRNTQEGGINAMKKYLKKHGLEEEYIKRIEFPETKVPSVLHIDDRAVQFKGEFMNSEDILNFEPWKMK